MRATSPPALCCGCASMRNTPKKLQQTAQNSPKNNQNSKEYAADSSGCVSCSSCSSSAPIAASVNDASVLIIEKELEELMQLPAHAIHESQISKICEFLCASVFSSLCKLHECYREHANDKRLSVFLKLLSYFLQHQIRGICVFYALQFMENNALSIEQLLGVTNVEYRCTLITHINEQVDIYCVFNPNVSVIRPVE